MSFTLTVHHFRRNPTTGHRVLTKVTPYVAITQRGEGRLYAQSGKVWSEGGQEIVEVPEWFWDGWRKVSAERRKQIGLMLPEETGQRETLKQPLPGASKSKAA